MKKIAIAAAALAVFAAPSLAFANSYTYWDPSAGSNGGAFVTVQQGPNASEQAAAAAHDTANYGATVSYYDPNGADSSGGAIVTRKVNGDQPLIGTHDDLPNSQASQMNSFLKFQADNGGN